MNKKALAIVLIVWGAVASLFGALLVILSMSMITDGNDVLSTVVLIVIFLGLTMVIGAFPLRKGIHMLQGKEKKREKSVQKNRRMKQNLAEKPADSIQRLAEEEQPIEFSPEATSDMQILCRDEQFDKGDWPFIKALLKIVLYIATSVVVMIVGNILINKSAGGMPVANSWQAWASMLLTIGGSFLFVYSLLIWAKYNAMGNKFYYYIIDEKNGISVARLDTGKLGKYVAEKANALEKIKSTPSLLYIILFLLCSKKRYVAFQLARTQMYFQVNQKYHFVEELLLSTAYENYSDKIVEVRKIKYFSKGCQVWYSVLVNGVRQDRTQYIYRETTNYELLIEKLKAMCHDTRVGDELCAEQINSVRRNIGRRVVITMICAVIILGTLVSSWNIYMEHSGKAQDMLQAGALIRAYLSRRLTTRSGRRVVGIIFYGSIAFVGLLVKLLLDAVRVHIFTCVKVEVVSYYQKKTFRLKTILGDYKYFAKVRYNGMSLDVGMSKKTWEKKDTTPLLLVLRKKTPYCLVHQR